MKNKPSQQTPSSKMAKIWQLPLALALGFNCIANPSLANTSSVSVVPDTSSIQVAVSSNNLAQMEDQILHRINEQRQSHGLAPLKLNPQLSQVARAHSQQMVDQNFYGHVDLQGRNHRGRVEAAGIKGGIIGENLMKCMYSNDPVSLSVQSWMDSPKHRKNILLTQMEETGIGISHQGDTVYVTQLFMDAS